MKYLLLSGLFCCLITGSIHASSNDLVPFAQDVATGLAKGAAWTAGGVAAGALLYGGRILYFNRHAANYTLQGQGIYLGNSDVYVWRCVRAGAGIGILHGLKYMGFDESYLQGAALMGGSLVALKQVHRVFRSHISQTWYNTLFRE